MKRNSISNEFNITELDTEENRTRYSNLLEMIGGKNPYYTTGFINAFCSGINSACFFNYENRESGAIIILPGYLRKVVIGEKETPFYDFISPYGYSGPLMNSVTTELDIIAFWETLDKWYLENNVVCEFIRFGLFNNQKFYSGKVVPTLSNVKGRIYTKEEQWLSYDRKVRKNVNKAQRENLFTRIFYLNITDEVVDIFHHIYIHTMRRNDVATQFYYSNDQFKEYIKLNEKQSLIAIVYDGNIPVSAELVLVDDECIYSFLGGTISEAFEKRPNDLLKHDVINWCRLNGIAHFVLGGGYGQDDGIFKYKKAFFPDDVVSYFTGRKVINKRAYLELLEECNKLRVLNDLDILTVEDESFFPLYKKNNK